MICFFSDPIFINYVIINLLSASMLQKAKNNCCNVSCIMHFIVSGLRLDYILDHQIFVDHINHNIWPSYARVNRI